MLAMRSAVPYSDQHPMTHKIEAACQQPRRTRRTEESPARVVGCGIYRCSRGSDDCLQVCQILGGMREYGRKKDGTSEDRCFESRPGTRIHSRSIGVRDVSFGYTGGWLER